MRHSTRVLREAMGDNLPLVLDILTVVAVITLVVGAGWLLFREYRRRQP